ncbi:MAG: DUF1284 domain-containing protein [Proteobacteria bacterium]|nr:DUF1284 domain-containing protein [Pseudomonadota bacterium]
MEINFRPHHFLCTFCFQGKGYSPDFVANYQNIVTRIQQDPETKIKVVDHTDSVCTPCPHRQGLGCASQEKVTGLDEAHSQVLELKPNDVLTWQEAKLRIITKLTLEKFHHICATCSWKPLGVCEQVLTDHGLIDI